MIQIIVHVFAGAKDAVVEVLFASTDKTVVEEKLAAYQIQFPEDYLAIYDLPLDTELSSFTHYPSVAISIDDFAD